jgi:predicted transcriptional regulator
MSEVNPDTTAVPVTNPVKTRVKDPRRVEAGRRLARISKEAKARKKAQLEAIKEKEQNVLIEESENDGSIVTLERVGLVVGIAVGLGSLYVMWCSRQEKDEKLEENKIVEEPKPVVTTPKGPDLFD